MASAECKHCKATGGGGGVTSRRTRSDPNFCSTMDLNLLKMAFSFLARSSAAACKK